MRLLRAAVRSATIPPEVEEFRRGGISSPIAGRPSIALPRRSSVPSRAFAAKWGRPDDPLWWLVAKLFSGRGPHLIRRGENLSVPVHSDWAQFACGWLAIGTCRRKSALLTRVMPELFGASSAPRTRTVRGWCRGAVTLIALVHCTFARVCMCA